MNDRSNHGVQRGMALVVGLIMLLCLTILGVAGMHMARTELIMAGNSQLHAMATASAESQIDVVMDPEGLNLATNLFDQPLASAIDARADGSWSAEYIGDGSVPVGSFSRQDNLFSARFFEFRATIDRYAIDTNVETVQGGFLIGPGN